MKMSFLQRTRPSGCPVEGRGAGKIAGGGWAAGQPEDCVLTFCNQGVMLIECLLYIGMFFVILGVAFGVFYACWDSAKALRRNTDQIAATLRTGERWRQDVRSATASLRVEDSTEGTILRIPEKSGQIEWRFSEGALWRRANGNEEWMRKLDGVKSSRMENDHREKVNAWRWEVELTTRRKGARVVPLFTFEAVPHPGGNP